MKKPTNRKFEYQPRFYKPESDEDEKRKRKLGFKTSLMKSKRSSLPWTYIILLLIILFILLKYNGYI